ncbi:Sodium channel and clathrin linker 1 [Geranomyces variabilis]|uniref:Sodium channel and clathrin linker 1 n=1 Tax=Geranomyces variabilis TaxID=109894 RepID=A0AAD5XJT2_9FUNG|nr:Sodium channel and clathrin linker 1 [Geranomyces variabilis]
MFPTGSMLTREDRARLLRETVLKSSHIENLLPQLPGTLPPDPADLQIPLHRRDTFSPGDSNSPAAAGLDDFNTRRLAIARGRHQDSKEETPDAVENAPPPPQSQPEPTPTRKPPATPSYQPRKSTDNDLHAAYVDLQARCRRLETDNADLHARLVDSKHTTQRARDETESAERELRTTRSKLDALQTAADDAARREAAFANITPQEWREANERVDVLIGENDALMSRTRERERDMDELQALLARRDAEAAATASALAQTQQQNTQLRADLAHACERADAAVRESTQCEAELLQANIESDKLAAENRRWAGEVKALQESVGDLKNSLEEITIRYQTHVRESHLLAHRERELLDNLQTTQYERDELASKCHAQATAHTQLRAENEELLSISKAFETRIAVLEGRAHESAGECARQTEIAQEAKLEYEKALITEQALQADLQRRAERLLEIPARARERAEQEIATMRAQFQTEKHALHTDISQLEQRCTHLSHQADRAIRDKRAAESELEKLSRHIPEESERVARALEDVNARLRAAERDKAVVGGRLESLHQKLLREEGRWEKERQMAAERSEDAWRRLRNAERELEETKEAHLATLTKLTDLTHAHTLLSESKTQLQQTHTAQLNAQHQAHTDTTTQLATKISQLSKHADRLTQDLHQISTLRACEHAQHRAEHDELQSTHARVVADLRAQVGRSEARVEEVEKRCGELGAVVAALERKCEEERRLVRECGARLRVAETRAEVLARQVASASRKEVELVDERKRLQRELDRARMDRERIEREHAAALREAHSRLRPSIHDDPDPDSVADDNAAQVRELKAEIDRVKHRTQARSHQRHAQAVMGGLAVAATTMDGGGNDNDELDDLSD